MAGISGVAVGAVGIGALLAYAGIKGKSVPAELQALIQGKSPGSAAPAAAIAGTAPDPAAAAAAAAGSAGGGGGPPSANQALGRLMAAAYGWGTGDEWAFLKSGWQEESGWSTTAAYNKSDPYNSAYGIPQANPGTKMATAGADWKTSAATQIKWGLDYIKRTYGSPTRVPGWSASGPVAGYQGY